MTKVDVVRAEMVKAMKAGDKERKNALSMLLSALKNATIDKRSDLTEEEADEEVEGWCETNWSQDDWKDWYGVDTDEELEDAQDSDGYWND